MKRICIRVIGLATLLSTPALSATAGEDVPRLKEGLISQSYEVSFVSEPYMANITFHRQGRFFMLGDARRDEILKFDASGKQVFRLKYAAGNFRPAFSPYVVNKRGIYDFSQPQIRLIRFESILNGTNKRMSRERFLAEFSQHYAKAEIVAYGVYNDDNSKHAIYLRTGGRWAVFYVSTSTIDIDRDYDLGNSIAGFPPKYERMVLLKDPARKRYSYDDYRLRDREIALPEDKLRYARNPSLKRTSYKSSFVFEEIPYTPIPGAFAGMATYLLSVGGEKIAFREIAVRGALRARATFNMSLFVLPSPYGQDVPVSFLEFRPISNVDTLGSDGLYIIRPRR